LESLNSIERITVPLLLVQTASVIFLWTLDTLGKVSQTIFTLFLSADLLAFGLMAHIWVATKTGDAPNRTVLMVWGLVILVLFGAGFIYS
jgi:hypothetical protein